MDATLEDEQAAQRHTEARITKRLQEIESQENRYVDLLGDPDYPQEKLKTKLATLRQERANLTGQLTTVANSLQAGRQIIAQALELLTDPYELYKQLPDPERRLMTLTVFGSLNVDTKQIVGHQLNPPFAELLDAQQRVNTSRSYHRRTGSQATHQDPQPKEDTLTIEDALLNELSTPELLEYSL